MDWLKIDTVEKLKEVHKKDLKHFKNNQKAEMDKFVNILSLGGYKGLIEQFIKKVKEKYPNLIIGYENIHDEWDSEDFLEIWHTDYELEFNDKEFRSYLGGLIKELFMDNGIYNICVCYEYEKFLEFGKGE